jgi:hypothetical protein
MAKVISLVDTLPVTLANEDCVATLRRMLELAEAGEIVTLAVAAVCRDGDGLWVLCETDKASRYLTLSGALRQLEMDINEAIRAEDEDLH